MDDQSSGIFWIFGLGVGSEGDETGKEVTRYALIGGRCGQLQKEGSDASRRDFGSLLLVSN